MIISTTEELRLYAPSNAIDHIETMAGYFNASEHDFLEDKLGTALYDSLQQYYTDNLVYNDAVLSDFIHNVLTGSPLTPYQQLLSVCQRVVVYDALARAIDMQVLSVNGAGVNIPVADDYNKPDAASIAAYKSTCIKESHTALNRLLILLERWTKESATAANADAATVLGDSVAEPSDEEKSSIVSLWRTSRYFFLCASMLIPSCEVLQQYFNIYDSREKYIQLLPDLRYIQEDILEPVIGEDLLAFFVEKSINGTEEKLLCRIIHSLRKYISRELEYRTKVIKTDDNRRTQAHDESVHLMTTALNIIKDNIPSLLALNEEATIASPLYTATSDHSGLPGTSGSFPSPSDKEATVPGDFVAGPSTPSPRFQNNRRGNAFFATPSLL